MRWLLVGAVPGEVAPVLRALDQPRPASARLILGTLEGAPVGVLCCGVGAVAAERRVGAALARWEADAVVSFGTCGALADALAVGDVVAGGSGAIDGGLPWRAPPWPGLPVGHIATVSRVVDHPARRAALAAAGYAVCEMEAAGVAKAAGSRAFHAIKVVSDLAGVDARFGRWGALPSPTAWLRFQVLAARLVQHQLLPELRARVTGQGQDRC